MNTDWLEKINAALSLEDVETLRIDIFGKKGDLTLDFAKMKDVPNEQKKAFAQHLNEQKTLSNEPSQSKKTT